MKERLCILALLTLLCVGRLSAQGVVSVSATEEPVSDIIKKIEQTSNFVFVFDESTSQALSKRVSIKANAQPIGKVMEQLLSGTGLEYKISQRQVMIFTACS